ncbi:MAG: hypothetical protein WC489_02245 [Patescibacteria group bacterium]
MPQEPDGLTTRINLPVPGDYAQSAQIMNPADKSLYLSQQFDRFITKVRKGMSPEEIDNLPGDTQGYVDAVVARSLDHVDSFHADLADVVVARYYLNPYGERFIFDPVHRGALFLDSNGELITLVGARIHTDIPEGNQPHGARYIASHTKSFVWTGPDAEKEFTPEELPITKPKPLNHEHIAGRPERTKITPQMRVDMLLKLIRNKMQELGQPVPVPADATATSFVNAHIRSALSHIDLFKDDLADTIAFLYHYSSSADRFIRDPNTDGILFIDDKGDLVILNNPQILKSLGDGSPFINRYDSSTALTGPDKGKALSLKEKNIDVPVKPKQYRVISK